MLQLAGVTCDAVLAAFSESDTIDGIIAEAADRGVQLDRNAVHVSASCRVIEIQAASANSARLLATSTKVAKLLVSVRIDVSPACLLVGRLE